MWAGENLWVLESALMFFFNRQMPVCTRVQLEYRASLSEPILFSLGLSSLSVVFPNHLMPPLDGKHFHGIQSFKKKEISK